MPKSIKANEKILSEGDLQSLAHAGTAEAIAKIKEYLAIEPDKDKRSYAEIALEESEMFYYSPNSAKEEEEFLLAYLISQRENKIEKLELEIESINLRIEKLALEKKVHLRVMAAHKNKKEEWQYRWLEDFKLMEESRLQETKNDLAYEEAWVAEAKKMITTPRYKTIPASHLQHYDLAFDDDEEGAYYHDDFYDNDKILPDEVPF